MIDLCFVELDKLTRGEGGRERERETERQKKREKEKDRKRERERDRQRQTDRGRKIRSIDCHDCQSEYYKFLA